MLRWTQQIKKKTWRSVDIYSVGGVNHLTNLLNGILPNQEGRSAPLPLGANFIFNNPDNINIGSDGYDNALAPVDSNNLSLFSRRMWVSGQLQWNGHFNINDTVICNEKVVSIRKISSSVFVSTERLYSLVGQSQPTIKEVRNLVYTNDAFSGGSPRPAPEITRELAKKVVFSESDVAKFCSLSFNLHKIHRDLGHCAGEGFRDIVVPGPLLSLVMLRHLQMERPDIMPMSFSYKMSSPCYINEELYIASFTKHSSIEVVIWGKDGKRCEGIAK